MKRFLPVLLIVLLLAGCSEPGAPLVATDVVIRKPVPGMSMSAGYLTLANHSRDTLTITHVTSPQFEAVEMHESIVEDGISRMVEIGAVDIQPDSEVIFEPGGKHLMLMRPGEALDVVTLNFHSDDTIVLTIEASPAG